MKHMKTYSDSSKNLWIILIILSAALLHIMTSYPVKGPFIHPDEGGYLMNAASLVGFHSDSASSYHLGYSLFIFPAFLLFDHPDFVYRFVQLINVLLNVISIFFIFKICEKIFPDESTSKILMGTAVAAFYPAWFVYSSCALSENAYVLFFVLSVFFCIMASIHSGKYWFFWALTIGFLFFIHPKAAPVVLAAGSAAILIAWQQKRWDLFALFFIIVSFMVLSYHYAIQPWLVDRQTIGPAPPALHYLEPSGLLNAFFSWSRFVDFLSRTSGHVMYLLLGSLGLVGLGVLFFLNLLYDNLTNCQISKMTGPAVFMVLSLFGTILLSAFFFTGSTRFDTWIYGRYTEGVLFPLIAVGFITFHFKKYYIVFFAAVVLALILGIAHNDAVEHMFYPFISSFWIGIVFRDFHPFVWSIFCLPLFLFIFIFKTIHLRFVAISFFYVIALIFVNISIVASSEFWYNRTVLTNYIRNYSDFSEKIIAIERPDMQERHLKQLAYKSNFVFYLFDYSVTQMNFEQWKDNYEGLFVSFRNDLNQFNDDLYIIQSETEDGPYIWMKTNNF